MAHFEATIETRAEAKKAFDYLADFSNTRFWDPSVSTARRSDTSPIALGSRFEVELGLPGQPLVFDYEVLRYEPHSLIVLRAESDRLRSLDTIGFEETAQGCRVHYDADLRLAGALYLFDPALHLGFQWSGARSVGGLAKALDELT